MSTKFSNRHGYGAPEPEIVIRENAPENLRYAVAQIAVDSGLPPSKIREVICRILYVAPDRSNWSEYPNIWSEVEGHLQQCPWFKVYDIAEALFEKLPPFSEKKEHFKDDLNTFFKENGIGWELQDDGIKFRGSEAFTVSTGEAAAILTRTGKTKAANEIHEALRDISRRPTPDVTGAMQHAMAALECTARDTLQQPNATLGSLLPRLAIPRPLDVAVEKLWGFASERARHVREGDMVEDTQAELLVSVACAVCVFIAKRGAGSI